MSALDPVLRIASDLKIGGQGVFPDYKKGDPIPGGPAANAPALDVESRPFG